MSRKTSQNHKCGHGRRSRRRGRKQRYTHPPTGKAGIQPPDGVQFDIVPISDSGGSGGGGGGGGSGGGGGGHGSGGGVQAGRALDKDGRPAVWFKQDQPYFLQVENNFRDENGKARHIAFMVWVDGRPVSAAPLMVRPGSVRKIHGFLLSRERVPMEDPLAAPRTVSVLEDFVARRPTDAAAAAANAADDDAADDDDGHHHCRHHQDGALDFQVGQVRVEFDLARSFRAPHSEHRHFHVGNLPAPLRQLRSSPPGVLETRDGPRREHKGSHAGSHRVVPEGDWRLGSVGITIYERTERS